MRKIMIGLLSILLIGCSAKKDAKTVLQEAYEKDLSTSSITLDGTMGVDVDLGGTSVTLPLNMDLMYERGAEDDLSDDAFYMDVSLSLMGQSAGAEIWYADGVMYIDDGTNRQALPVEVSADVQTDRKAGIESLMKLFGDASMEQDGSDTIITTTVDSNRLMEFLRETAASGMDEEALEDMLGNMESMFETVKFSEVKITIGSDGYISRVSLGGSMSIEDFAGDLTADFELKDRNSTVVPRVDPDEFTAYDGQIPLPENDPAGGDYTDLLDDYTVQIDFDDGTQFVIRSPREQGIYTYFDDEEQLLYFFDDTEVFAGGTFMATPTLQYAESEVSGDTAGNYRALGKRGEGTYTVSEYYCINETDIMNADTLFGFVLYRNKPLSLLLFAMDGVDEETFTRIVDGIDFDLTN